MESREKDVLISFLIAYTESYVGMWNNIDFNSKEKPFIFFRHIIKKRSAMLNEELEKILRIVYESSDNETMNQASRLSGYIDKALLGVFKKYVTELSESKAISEKENENLMKTKNLL